jgi:uncharacterized glyoxalase superfamily protein PhnB
VPRAAWAASATARTKSRTKVSAASISTPLQTEPWGERFFQVADPNGVVVQFVQWLTDPEGAGAQ